MNERILKVFDYQRFSPNPRLAALISDTVSRCHLLSDEDLLWVSAAGLPEEMNPGDPEDPSEA